MVKQNTQREQLEKIIYEELLKEGILDRLIARTHGNASKIKQLGKNTSTMMQAITKGKLDIDQLKDPKLVQNIEMAVSRIKSYDKKFAKLLFDFTSDLETMFGPNLGANPQIKSLLDKLDNSSTQFAKEIKDVGQQIQGIISGAGKNVGTTPQQNQPSPVMPNNNIPDQNADWDDNDTQYGKTSVMPNNNIPNQNATWDDDTNILDPVEMPNPVSKQFGSGLDKVINKPWNKLNNPKVGKPEKFNYKNLWPNAPDQQRNINGTPGYPSVVKSIPKKTKSRTQTGTLEEEVTQ